jgi:hypothetical protein
MSNIRIPLPNECVQFHPEFAKYHKKEFPNSYIWETQERQLVTKSVEPATDPDGTVIRFHNFRWPRDTTVGFQDGIYLNTDMSFINYIGPIFCFDQEETPSQNEDICKSCGSPGEVIRTACICSKCGEIIWGF